MHVRAALDVARSHDQRMDDRGVGGGKPLAQALLVVLVHQEADGAAVHAVDRLAGFHQAVQGAQHQAVAAQRHHDVGASPAPRCRSALPAGRRPCGPPAPGSRQRRSVRIWAIVAAHRSCGLG
jgi:hypothetical protein